MASRPARRHHIRTGVAPSRLTGMQKPARLPLGESPFSIHHESVLSCLHDVADDGRFTERLAGFQPMQPFDQHVAFAVAADQDGRLLADLKDALGDLGHGLGLERRTTLHRHIDVGDRKYLALHHGSSPPVAGSDLGPSDADSQAACSVNEGISTGRTPAGCHLTLRFSADVLPRLLTSSNSTRWPSLSDVNPAR